MLFANLTLFAQQQFGGGGRGGGPEAFPPIVLCIELPFIFIGLGLFIWFLVGTYGALNAVSPRNRDMEPGMVFLLLVPCLNLVWYFLVVIRVGDSLQREYSDRGMRGDGDFGKTLGIIMILLIIFCGPIGWILQIVYLMKLRGYVAQLSEDGGGHRRRRDYDDDDDDDDRPSRRRRDDADDGAFQ